MAETVAHNTKRRVRYGDRNSFQKVSPGKVYQIFEETKEKEYESIFLEVNDKDTQIVISDGDLFNLVFTPDWLYLRGYTDYVPNQEWYGTFDEDNLIFVTRLVFPHGWHFRQKRIMLRPKPTLASQLSYAYEIIAVEPFTTKLVTEEGKVFAPSEDKLGAPLIRIIPPAKPREVLQKETIAKFDALVR